jgi:hypothetical protein
MRRSLRHLVGAGSLDVTLAQHETPQGLDRIAASEDERGDQLSAHVCGGREAGLPRPCLSPG